jgi:hypothetical protein
MLKSEPCYGPWKNKGIGTLDNITCAFVDSSDLCFEGISEMVLLRKRFYRKSEGIKRLIEDALKRCDKKKPKK